MAGPRTRAASGAGSRTVLRSIPEPGRADGHDGAVQQIVELCGRLPLALRIAATRLRHRPTWTPEQLAGRLTREHDRLGELTDSDRSVASAFAVS